MLFLLHFANVEINFFFTLLSPGIAAPPLSDSVISYSVSPGV